MSEINFDLNDTDRALLTKIVQRAKALKLGKPNNLINVEMSIAACHLNGCPLDLQELLDFSDFDFTHDVCGIDRHTSRHTGQLTDHFLPRCSR